MEPRLHVQEETGVWCQIEESPRFGLITYVDVYAVDVSKKGWSVESLQSEYTS